MGVIGIILLVAFIIICVLLIAIVLIQNEDGGGLGGLLGGGAQNTTFGSRSGNVLTKTTYVLVALFFLSSFGLALVNKAPTVKDLAPAVTEESAENNEEWYKEGSDVLEQAPAVIESNDAAEAKTE